MPETRSAAVLPRLRALELAVCLACARVQRRQALAALLRMASRLGDGPAWLALAPLLPLLFGAAALDAVARLALAGVACAVTSKALKHAIDRPRPYLTHHGIELGVAPLDRFSFPSGHTLHAVALTAVAVAHFPAVGWVLVPFTLLVAWSRVALGVHYPSDVLAGAAAGGVIAWATLAWL
jgi:undecaprenyl-diphosphatase